MKELKSNLDQEVQYLPKEAGLSLIESTQEVNLLNKLLWKYISKLYLKT